MMNNLRILCHVNSDWYLQPNQTDYWGSFAFLFLLEEICNYSMQNRL
jgi:hypothetical protein